MLLFAHAVQEVTKICKHAESDRCQKMAKQTPHTRQKLCDKNQNNVLGPVSAQLVDLVSFNVSACLRGVLTTFAVGALVSNGSQDSSPGSKL